MRRLLCIAVLAALTSSCSAGSSDFDMSVRRVALTLAFTDEEKAEPVEPTVIVRLLPAPPAALAPGADLSNIPLSMPPKCPAAPPGASVVDIGTFGIQRPPAPGTYRRHNEGNLTITTTLPITIPFPRSSRWEISDVREVTPPAATDDPLAPAAGTENAADSFPPGEVDGAPMWEYTVHKVLTPQFSITDTYRLTSRRVLLLKRVTTTQDGETAFTPEPPISVLEHADGEGHTWRSAGVDTTTGTAMVVDGRVERREPVDVCGTLHDTYRVVTVEQVVNLETGATSGTAEDDPNVYNVASQLGGLVLREDVHFTQTIATADGAAVVEWDYQSTQDTTEPEPPR